MIDKYFKPGTRFTCIKDHNGTWKEGDRGEVFNHTASDLGVILFKSNGTTSEHPGYFSYRIKHKQDQDDRTLFVVNPKITIVL